MEPLTFYVCRNRDPGTGRFTPWTPVLLIRAADDRNGNWIVTYATANNGDVDVTTNIVPQHLQRNFVPMCDAEACRGLAVHPRD